jgi:TonB family protein
MNRVFSWFVVALLLHGGFMLAQSESTNPAPNTSAGNNEGPLQLRSDTKGFDLSKYTNKLFSVVHSNWYELIPEEARAPQRVKGKVSVNFRVMKDGTITNVEYAEHSGYQPLDQAAFDSIIHSSPLKPLPANFECSFVAFRFHFFYNPDPDGLKHLKTAADSEPLMPCVTTTIRLDGTEIKR